MLYVHTTTFWWLLLLLLCQSFNNPFIKALRSWPRFPRRSEDLEEYCNSGQHVRHSIFFLCRPCTSLSSQRSSANINKGIISCVLQTVKEVVRLEDGESRALQPRRDKLLSAPGPSCLLSHHVSCRRTSPFSTSWYDMRFRVFNGHTCWGALPLASHASGHWYLSVHFFF